MRYASRILAITLIAAFVLIAASSCSSLLKAKGSVGGTVYVRGRPEPNCTVIAYPEAGGPEAGQIRANNGGHYHIKDLAPGRYYLVVLRAQGTPYEEETLVEIGIGKFETVDIKLMAGVTVE